MAVLAKEGIPPSEAVEAAQEVWLTVYRKLASGEPEPDSWPAYLTTLAQGRAANHRRSAQHRRATSLPSEGAMTAGRLSPEEVVILYGLIDSIPSPDQREAVLLWAQGYSIREIAEKQSITEAGVKKRIKTAGEHVEKELERDERDDKKRSGAFWGFGSFEALIDALSDDRERRWKDIEAAIREIESPPDPHRPSGPKSAAPVIPLLPKAGPTLAAAAGKVTLLTFFSGAALLGGAYLSTRSGAARESAPVVVCPEPPAGTIAPAPSISPPPARGPSPDGTVAARPAASSDRTRRPAARGLAEPEDFEDLLLREREDRAGRRQ